MCYAENHSRAGSESINCVLTANPYLVLTALVADAVMRKLTGGLPVAQ